MTDGRLGTDWRFGHWAKDGRTSGSLGSGQALGRGDPCTTGMPLHIYMEAVVPLFEMEFRESCSWSGLRSTHTPEDAEKERIREEAKARKAKSANRELNRLKSSTGWREAEEAGGPRQHGGH